MGVKTRVAEQKPVKKENVIEFHAIQHNKKSYEEAEKTAIAAYTIPSAQDECADKHQNGKPCHQPTDCMCAVKSLLFIQDYVKNFLRCGGEEPFILN